MTSLPGYLDSTVADVPHIMTPVVWDTGNSITANANNLTMWREEYSRLLPVGAAIDEAAVMVPSPWHAREFINNLVAAGWDHFNGADDLVYTNPFGTRYFVRYEFLRSPALPWRLEVMHMSEGRIDGSSGFSPLHQSLWTPDGRTEDTVSAHRFPVPHLSFKVPMNGSSRQPRAAYSRAVGHLQSRGCIHAQTCQSTYGVFGYYLPNDATKQLYIKPRLNTRDSGPAACGQAYPCEHAPDGGNHPVASA